MCSVVIVFPAGVSYINLLKLDFTNNYLLSSVTILFHTHTYTHTSSSFNTHLLLEIDFVVVPFSPLLRTNDFQDLHEDLEGN